MDKYIVEKELGRGAFGITYLVKAKADGQTYVLKELKLQGVPERDRQAAVNEVGILSSFDHPNIVRYRESFESNGNLYIAMEFADGGDAEQTLRRHKKNKTKIPESQIGRWLAQMCLALKHLHDRKVLHRDLKCANVFLTRDGVIKLGDFGLSRTIEGTFAMAGTVCGTPYYYSPELAVGKPYNSKSDIWALGCILVELTTFERTFPAKTMEELVQKILHSPLPPITGYSPGLASLIHLCLSRDPHQRPGANALICHPYVSAQLREMSATLSANIARISSRVSAMDAKFGPLPPVKSVAPPPAAPVASAAPTSHVKLFTDLVAASPAVRPVATRPAPAAPAVRTPLQRFEQATLRELAATPATKDDDYEDDFFDHEAAFEEYDEDDRAVVVKKDDRARQKQLLATSMAVFNAVRPMVENDLVAEDIDWEE